MTKKAADRKRLVRNVLTGLKRLGYKQITNTDDILRDGLRIFGTIVILVRQVMALTTFRENMVPILYAAFP